MTDYARHKLLKARVSLLLEQPFFGSLCLRMEPAVDHACRTAWTNGRVLGFNPHYVAGLSDEAAKGLLAHTVMHPACQHHKRRKGRDHDLWNMACDHAINWILVDAGLTLPPGYLDDPKYHGLTADEIYSELASLQGGDGMISEGGDGPEKGEMDPQGLKGTAGESGQQGEDEREASGTDNAEEQGQGEDSESGGEAEQSGDEAENGSGDPGGSGEVRDAGDEDGSSPEGGDETDEQWRIALAQAVNQTRDSGDLPGGLERLVERVLHPKLDWRALLERFINTHARNDYAWIPPNRRFVHMNIFLPSLAQRELPEVVIAVDTSGSIAPGELDQFSAELSAVLEQFDTTVRVVWCDREVTGEQVFRRDELPLRLTPSGGGGTDFRPVFRWVRDHACNPSCLVYLSDMECRSFPEQEPEYPVLWARMGGAGSAPPFGDIVDIR
ncbi:vWA domain-containing protein [Salidesulfovibrio onnuriiensis]|uniref:vWA domain-containing protein n=1 Tax=Salidesulfovibrio onnuriiensis TaxID=2583823 RepID=UPI0011CAA33C|nr:VWA-like domain-containing protein [Salidesulfovibrio onnuriiensis]